MNSKVALIHGKNRYQNIYQSLELIKDEVKRGLAGKKSVILKPNLTSLNHYALANTHIETVRAVLDFIQQFYPEKIIIAEDSGSGDTKQAFESGKYYELEKSYNIELRDLSQDKFKTIKLYNSQLEKELPQHISETVLNSDYLISLAIPKTHDYVIATLALKNVLVAACREKWKGNSANMPKTIHQGARATNLNMFELAKMIQPHLSILDGFVGMEGNGPVSGTPIEMKIALAGTDWLAVDSVGVNLMGLNTDDIGYLHYCKKAKMGKGDLSEIELLGEKDLDKYRQTFKLHDDIENQKKWPIKTGESIL